MNFKSALKYLDSFISYEKFLGVNYSEKNFDLDRFRDFLKKYGVDFARLKYIHVAGSKGKGTTATLIANYLWMAGYKVGLYTSPHIFDLTERFWLNGFSIDREKFAGYVADLKRFIESNGLFLTYFELLTVIAFKFFGDHGVYYVVLEVGVGGRLDATNVVTPELSILTTVELEHTEILGNTLEKILKEKLGIMKRGVPVLIGFQSLEVYRMIRKKIERGSDIFYVEEMSTFKMDDSYDLSRLKNARVSFVALRLLLKKIDLELFLKIFEKIKLPGRFEIRKISGKLLVLDMAHTENSVKNLVEGLVLKFPRKKFVFLLSIMKNKQVEAMCKTLSDFAHKIFFTNANKNRGHKAKELLEIYEKFRGDNAVKKIASESCKSAYNRAFAELEKNEVLVVTGSHYLVSKILKGIEV